MHKRKLRKSSDRKTMYRGFLGCVVLVFSLVNCPRSAQMFWEGFAFNGSFIFCDTSPSVPTIEVVMGASNTSATVTITGGTYRGTFLNGWPATVKYRFDAGNWETSTNNCVTIPVTKVGQTTVEARSVNSDGEESASVTANINIENTGHPPAETAEPTTPVNATDKASQNQPVSQPVSQPISQPIINVPSGWSKEDVTVNIIPGVSPDSRATKMVYQIDDSNVWLTYTGSFLVTKEGLTTIRAKMDGYEQAAITTATVKIDKTAPNSPRVVIQSTWENEQHITIEAGTDAGSGNRLLRYRWGLSNGEWEEHWTDYDLNENSSLDLKITNDVMGIQVQTIDEAGNTSPMKTSEMFSE